MRARILDLVDTDASLDDLREAVEILEDTARITRRVFGSSHPIATGNQNSLRNARAALHVGKGGFPGNT